MAALSFRFLPDGTVASETALKFGLPKVARHAAMSFHLFHTTMRVVHTRLNVKVVCMMNF